jgi:hypothetical protein
MAGGKETPRQKMIGMMYLVLTALLALNVSKQIVAAFITLNDKIDSSSASLDNRIDATYSTFDQKGATLRAERSDLKIFELWSSKAENLKKASTELVSFLLSECNEMIKLAEGKDWIELKDESGNITKLKSLDGIQNMDDYDIPTNMFVGGNPSAPNGRGAEIVNRIHRFRNEVVESMGTYQQGDRVWEFHAPEKTGDLPQALKTANPADTASLSQFYKSMTIPDFLNAHGEDKELPWVSVTFDHAPIVAAAAMFTSLKLDVKNAQAFASEYMLEKIEVTPFIFNKIDPLAFASTGYINQGDSLNLKVMIAAYDSNDVSKIRWGMDADTANRNLWKESSSGISLAGSQPGVHKVKGEIGVKERGQLAWKPWEFSYTVGQPMGVVAQPEMRIFYWGYSNKIEGTASGFPADKITLSGNGCRLESLGNGKYIAHVERGVRTARVSVTGQNSDGTKTSLGTFDYVCKPLPKAAIYFGRSENGSTAQLQEAKSVRKVRVALPPEVALTGVNYTIRKGKLVVGGLPGEGSISAGGVLDSRALNLVTQAKDKYVSVEIEYSDPAGTVQRDMMTFLVK